MTYFTNEFLSFLSELRANNNREWFHANKKRYEEHVKKPFHHFIDTMIEQVRMVDPDVLITPKDAIFRIYRDTRFSKDKTPYKVQASAVVSAGGRKDMTTPGIYIQLSDENMQLYSGIYRPDSKQLRNIREHIASNIEQFDILLKEKNFKEKFGGEIHGEKNKRIPKEFMDIAAQQPLIYNKAFYYYHTFPPETILKKNLPDIVMEYYHASRPMSKFLKESL